MFSGELVSPFGGFLVIRKPTFAGIILVENVLILISPLSSAGARSIGSRKSRGKKEENFIQIMLMKK